MGKRKGFTLIELLLVIVIIAILAVVVFVALNPVKRLQDSRNARRTTDVTSILSAVHSYIVDNQGAAPSGLTVAQLQIGTAGTATAISANGCTVAAGGHVDLGSTLASYLKTMPIDPSGGTTYTSAATGYAIDVDANGLVTVTACNAEGTTIVASR